MISLSAIWAVVLRHAYMWRRDPNYILGGFYWPFLDILMWGFLGTWLQNNSATPIAHYETVALLGILLWQVIGRGCNIIAIALCEELWGRNMVNLFSLPLRLTEWMLGIILFNGIMTLVLFAFSTTIISLLYTVSLPYIISTFFLFMPPLFFSTLWIGFLCLSIIIKLGRRGAEFGFIIGWFCMPFSGAFYPVEVLPVWAQKFSKLLPMSYVFKGMRAYVIHQQSPHAYLIKGYIFSILLAAASMILFMYCFNRRKSKGLAQLSD